MFLPRSFEIALKNQSDRFGVKTTDSASPLALL
jgi:hypothetical protein